MISPGENIVLYEINAVAQKSRFLSKFDIQSPQFREAKCMKTNKKTRENISRKNERGRKKKKRTFTSSKKS